MSEAHARAYRHWLKIFSFVAALPLFFGLLFNLIAASAIREALGTQGSIIVSRVSITFSATFVLMLCIAHWTAWQVAKAEHPGEGEHWDRRLGRWLGSASRR